MQVLSKNGFKDFECIANQGESRLLLRISFEDGTCIKCTHDHLLKVDGEFIAAIFLDIGDVCDNKIIADISTSENEEVYDLLNVEDGSEYLTNGITSHNCNIIFLDEFAFVKNAAEFYTSTYPVISSGQNTKVIITSTANGIGNMFYKIWEGAVQNSSEFKSFRIDWWDVPGRGKKWMQQTIANTSQLQFDQEYGNSFHGNGSTLIAAEKLLALQAREPLKTMYDNCLRIYERPEQGHFYVTTVDVSQGRGQDYSAFSVFDVTARPFKQVVAYSNNNISPLLFPDVIVKISQQYNEALLLIENNGPGQVVCNSVYYDYEYENTYVESMVKAGGIGITQTKRTKRLGISNLKDIVEGDRLELYDAKTIAELSGFEESGVSFEARDGINDDLVMTLVIFSWFLSSANVSNYDEVDIKKLLFSGKVDVMNDELLEFGFDSDMHSVYVPSPEMAKVILDAEQWSNF